MLFSRGNRLTAQTACVLLALASLAVGEKKIELQDIEDDNLKSEMAKVQNVEFEDTDIGRFLKPPPHQPGVGYDQPRQPDFAKTQYEVQDTQADDYSNRDYLSSQLYPVQAQQEISQKDIGHGNFLAFQSSPNYISSQTAMFGYAQPLAMHLLYFPQYTAASSQVPTYLSEHETHPKVDIQTYSSPLLDNTIYQQQASTAGPAQQYSDYATQQQAMQSYAIQQTAQSNDLRQTVQSYAPQQDTQSYVLQQTTQDYVPQSYAPQIAYISVPSKAQYQQNNLQENIVIAADYQTQYTPNSIETSPKFVAKYEPSSKPTVIYPKPIFPSGSIKYKKPTHQHVTPTPTVQTLHSPHPQGHITQAIPTPSSLVYESHHHSNVHLPKVLSHHGHPLTRPVYSHIAGNLPQTLNRLPNHDALQNFIYVPKKKPTSLIDSYIPSSIQVEYLKRGLSKDPLSTYDTIAYSNRIHPGVKTYFPRVYERGFLPNQMIHTASGGIGFAQLKRGVKSGKTV